MRGPRILILYNEPVLPAGHPDADAEHEILFTVDKVSKALIRAGFTVSRLGASHDARLLVARLHEDRPDAVVNLYEGTADNGNTEGYVAGLLEWLGLPFTGSPSQALGQARNKHLTKYLLRGAHLPTPEFFVVERLISLPRGALAVPRCPLPWPVIVKPALQDASEGIDHGSVVTDQEQLEERVRYLLGRYNPPVLVEQFIHGREFNIGLIEAPELRVLPFSEIVFTANDPACWPIMTYEAKWKPGTRDFESTSPRLPAETAPELAERLERLACQAFRLLGCRDYARVDFRVNGDGSPYIIEVNPNPDLSPLAGLASGLEAAGLSYDRFMVDLVRTVLGRGTAPAAIKTKAGPRRAVRPARPGDRKGLRKVLETVGGKPPETTLALAALDEALKKGPATGYHTWVVEDSEQVVGYISFLQEARSPATYTLRGLAVLPVAQGKGYGRQLLQAAEAALGEAGARLLVVEAVSSQSGQAPFRQFLLRQEFQQVGDVPEYYGEGDSRLLYAKYLSPVGSRRTDSLPGI